MTRSFAIGLALGLAISAGCISYGRSLPVGPAPLPSFPTQFPGP